MGGSRYQSKASKATGTPPTKKEMKNMRPSMDELLDDLGSRLDNKFGDVETDMDELQKLGKDFAKAQRKVDRANKNSDDFADLLARMEAAMKALQKALKNPEVDMLFHDDENHDLEHALETALGGESLRLDVMGQMDAARAARREQQELDELYGVARPQKLPDVRMGQKADLNNPADMAVVFGKIADDFLHSLKVEF